MPREVNFRTIQAFFCFLPLFLPSVPSRLVLFIWFHWHGSNELHSVVLADPSLNALHNGAVELTVMVVG